MKAAIHQPQYFPYPGFFHKVSRSDILVIMDDVQYDKRFTNRNRILAPQGPIWISVPILKATRFLKNADVRVNNGMHWGQEHWKKIRYSYANSRHFANYSDFFEEFLLGEHESLLDLDLEGTRKVLEWLRIDVPIVLESELGVSGESTERLTQVCQAVGADTYLSGKGGKNYMDESLFEAKGISLEYQHYEAIPYEQRFGRMFTPDLSIVDMLFNLGPKSAEVIRGSDAIGIAQYP